MSEIKSRENIEFIISRYERDINYNQDELLSDLLRILLDALPKENHSLDPENKYYEIRNLALADCRAALTKCLKGS